MFDPKKPNNSLRKFPKEEFNFNDIDLLKQLNKTNIAITELNWVAKSIPNQKILLEFISIKEWIKSNEIEAIHTTVWDAFMAELIEDKTKISIENKETINYKDAIYFWYNKILKNWWIWFNDILEINKIITENNSWVISSPNKKIEKKDSSGKIEVVYTPPIWIDLIKELLYNFENYYNSFDEDIEIDPLLKLPIIHYQLEAIHPFWDWNWRTWRILMVLYFVLYKKLDLPIIFLSDFINKYKSDYYQYLRNIDKWDKNAIKDFTIWLLMWIQIQAIETQITIFKIIELKNSLKLKFKNDTELNKIYSRELLDFIFIRPFYSISKTEEKLWIHRNTASTYLNLLETKWILISKKYWKSKIFYYWDFFELLK